MKYTKEELEEKDIVIECDSREEFDKVIDFLGINDTYGTLGEYKYIEFDNGKWISCSLSFEKTTLSAKDFLEENPEVVEEVVSEVVVADTITPQTVKLPKAVEEFNTRHAALLELLDGKINEVSLSKSNALLNKLTKTIEEINKC